MAELQALIFDVDGTLADTERDGHRVAFNKAFADAGLDWDWSVELYGQLLEVTGGKERIRFYLDHFNTGFERPDDLDSFIADLHKKKTAHYTNMLAEGAIPMRSGVKRLLQEAREAGLRLAIATTTTPANVGALLQHSLDADAEGWFEVIAAGDIVPAKKPAPDIYSWAMQQMDISPDVCVAFEDSENGVKSAVGAGINTVLVTTNDYTEDHDFNGAELVLDQLGEPGDGFRVISGDAGGADHVDLALLRRFHAGA
ncbi:HAD family hydrolase [Candidatus Endoriftia persephone]|jgi:HAD superfamily hydrolase (TIGR01509 family)|uniref:HAD family hydrolase n=4 Tax=Gammaproteobacteria TaxID=1236 RepID=A0A9J6ZUC0_9GAMM|nr:HAD family hydrolase [Candidatus Endoriftia persephone]EGW55709.1 putative hydrolase, CbbY-like protein [endosymbiont of Tevnia jerichonana (vent Tica)]USF86304.1 HAD family hydrolase [Candidatus Endoriftia persephone]